MTSKPIINTPVGNVEGVSQSITAAAQSIVFPVGEDAGILLYLSGTAAGHNVTFEGTVDGVNWFLIPAVRTDTLALLTASGSVAGNMSYGFWLTATGCAAFRLRATSHGSGVATWTASYEEEMDFPPLSLIRATTTVPVATSASITSAVTTAAGTTFQAFPNVACTSLDVVNNTGVTIEVQRGGAGTAIPLLSGQARLFVGITSANQLGIRRVDQATTQVTVTAEAITS